MFFLLAVVFLSGKIQGEPARTPELQDLYPSTLSNVPESDSSWTKPNISPNVSADNAKLYVECDGSSYGYDLDLLDCEIARAYVAFDAQQYSWAQRDSPIFQKDIMSPLPYRVAGGG